MDIQTNSMPETTGNWVKDGTTETFTTDVVQESQERLVLVDLWAPWCGPCKQLGPVIEKVVNSAGGAVSLVKIDIDQNPQIAQALRVQSIPAVFAFKNGQPVDGFMGALPESQVKEFIEKNLGGEIGASPLEEALQTGIQALEENNTEVALAAFVQVLEADPDHVEAKAYLARVYIKLGEVEAAQSLLETFSEEEKQSPVVSTSEVALEIALNATDQSEISELREKLSSDPENMDLRFELAKGLISNGSYSEGGDELISLIKMDAQWNDGAARQELLKMFELLGPMHDVTKTYRRQLSAALFS
ncbi:thioredoxin [Sneathiella glossodoripedis]|uniref:thioredoxin n=1 Tax=Sneathiella glossodoripedis TaxID=418853 RepID=UPI000472AF7A|nr:thioredoxin [Sneathiella glossodoripedis]